MKLQFLEGVVEDLAIGCRNLRRSPRFALTAIVTVLLGLATSVTIFTLLNPLLFRPLPYPEPDRLVWVFRTAARSDRLPHSAAAYHDYRDRNRVFEQLAAVQWADFNLGEPDRPADRVLGLRVTANFFSTIGVAPQLGRVLLPEDDEPGGESVIVLSHRFWINRFNGDAGVVGRTLRLNGVPVIVVGVMPESFDYPLFWDSVDLWRPFAFTPEQRQDRRNNYLRAFGRLARGVSPAAANRHLQVLAEDVVRANPNAEPQESARVETLNIVGPGTRRVSMFTFVLSTLVLLMACVNLANLQMARTTERMREFAVRGALGAARTRLLRLSLAESMVIAAAGCVLAIPVASWATAVIVAWRYGEVSDVKITIDAASLAYALLATGVTGVVFGVLPAWLASRADVSSVLQQYHRTTTGGAARHRLRYGLVVWQVALAVIVVAAGASFVAGLQRIMRADPGWRPDQLMNASINLSAPAYASPQGRFALYDRLKKEAAGIPGVSHAALAASGLPVRGFNTTSSFIAERIEGRVMAFNERITPDYFDTIGMRLLEGRRFTETDRFGSTPVVIVNRAMARRLWPAESAIGKRLAFAAAPEIVWREVVGVVNDVTFPLGAQPDTVFQTYHPLAQGVPVSAALLLRVDGRTDAVASRLRRIMAAIEPSLPIYNIRTVLGVRRANTAELRVLSGILGGFGVAGSLLVAVGLFAVVSYVTRQRAGEMALRMALGARGVEVLWLVLKQGTSAILAGAAIGSLGGVAVARFLANAMPGTPQVEAGTIAGATAVVAIVALVACLVPSRRVLVSTPMNVLRQGP